MTKQEKIASLDKTIMNSKREDGTIFNHFSDNALKELKDLFLEHYNINDLDYEIFGNALDIVSEIYTDEAEKQRENKDNRESSERIVDCIYERAADSASIYTNKRLTYLNNQNEDEISQTMREYDEHSIATACAIWYGKQVEQAAMIINKWINA